MFLMNQWYAAALPDELTEKPMARQICGEHIALFSLTPMASTREIDRCARDAVRLFLDGCARPAGSSTIG